MTDLVVSDSLKNRREELMWQRRWKRLRSCWQFVCVCGLAGGMVWVMSWPEWSIRSDRQVEFVGNELLTRETLYKDLPLEYPEAVWKLSTRSLADELGKNPALVKAEVTRQLFPAQLNVAVQERQPVAIAVADQNLGYLDEEGNYIPGNLYSEASRATLPQTPQFLGFTGQYRTFWQGNQSRIRTSPVNIRIINGNNPSNISLTTDLGLVFLGSDLSRFEEQLQVLEKMQNLPSRIPKERLLFIDLTNPDSPSIQVKPQETTEKDTVNKP